MGLDSSLLRLRNMVKAANSDNNELLESSGMSILYDEPNMPWYATDPEEKACPPVCILSGAATNFRFSRANCGCTASGSQR